VADGLRRILHVDMDAFYASVEQRDAPGLRGQPVVVGGDPRGRGVVCAASYEARAYGVRSAMSMRRALALCPHAAVVRPDFGRYRDVSARVFALFREVTPLVEPLSLDEAYLDVTDNAWGEPLATVVARRLKAEIRARVALTASAGVAPNKFLAKIASGWQKPDGLTVIAPERVEAFLRRLPVDALWGVGPVTARKLRALGITRLVDVRTADPTRLRLALGSQTDWIRQLAQGHDPRPVQPDRPRKSVGAERTFANDLVDRADLERRVGLLATQTASWLARHALRARTVTVKVRYGDFTTVTRSASLGLPTDDGAQVAALAGELLHRTEAGRRPVRLVGVSLHNLVDARGLDTASRDRAADWLPFADELEPSPGGPLAG
jgi:DNA polymerase IV